MADTKQVIEILADSGVAGIDEHDLLNENQCAYVFPPFKDAVH